MANYYYDDKFVSEISRSAQRLVIDVAKSLDAKTHSAYLGCGSAHQAFELAHGGENFVVRIARNHPMSSIAAQRFDERFAPGRGIDGLEQLVSIDEKNSIIISSRVPGKELNNLDRTTIRLITDEDFERAIATVAKAVDAGVKLDTKPTNILYDTKDGFGFIDYFNQPHQLNADERSKEIANAVAGIGVGLTNAQFYGKDLARLDNREVERVINGVESGLDATDRLLKVAERKLDSQTYSSLKSVLDQQRGAMSDAINNQKVDHGIETSGISKSPENAWWR